ncbi:MAG: hypothetical protein JW959_12245 [Pirellulales bacterium]|nr:hypothetical protein [Pirellulales bacterium]
MEKAIFTITCTTCRARLAVRSEAAIGTILECPKCESMVYVVPPDGWTPPPKPGDDAQQAGPAPPPLDRICEAPLTLELDPRSGSLSTRIFALGGAALFISLIIAWVVWAIFSSSPTPEAARQSQVESPPTGAARETDDADGGQLTAPAQPPPEAIQNNNGVPTDAAADAEANDKTEGPSPPEAIPFSSGPPPTAAAPSDTASSTKTTNDPAEPSPLFPPAAEDKSDESTSPDYRKLPLPPLDLAARLDDAISGIELTDVSFVGTIDLLAAMSTLPITLDADAMAALGVSPRDRITIRLGPTSVGEALRAAAAEKGLAVAIDGAAVVITTPPEYREKQRKIRYTVSDLAADQSAGEELAGLIRRLVEPRSWRGNGGEGTIKPEGNALSIVQSDDVHRKVLIFCEKLRNARGLPLRSRENPDQFDLTTGADRDKKTLDRLATANFHQPAPLSRVLAYIGQQSGVDILVDRAALALADTSDQVEASVTVKDQKLGDALDILLRPLGLTYRVVAEDLIQVTTPDAIEERLELEFFPVADWLARGVSAERLVEELKGRVAPATWSDVGGDADIHFDAPSGCLVVLQSRPAQATIGRLLKSPK